MRCGSRFRIACGLALAIAGSASARVTLETAYGWPRERDKADNNLNSIVVDSRLPDYRRGANLSGRIRSVGSSGLSHLLGRWAEDFKQIYPDVTIEITGGGSESAPAALSQGLAELAPMTRKMNDRETAQFQGKFGYPPTRITIGVDAIAVYVNKHNPLRAISLEQLDGIFSVTRQRGGEPIRTWGQLGLEGEWKDLGIVIKSPGKTHGLYSLFREMVLKGGDYRYDIRPEPVSTSVVQGVGTDLPAIGFASYFYATRRTHALAIAADDKGPYYPPTQQNCVQGKYPLARFLYLYVNKKPAAPLEPLTAQFLRFICSKQGQETSAREGNFTLDAEVADRECARYIQ